MHNDGRSSTGSKPAARRCGQPNAAFGCLLPHAARDRRGLFNNPVASRSHPSLRRADRLRRRDPRRAARRCPRPRVARVARRQSRCPLALAAGRAAAPRRARGERAQDLARRDLRAPARLRPCRAARRDARERGADRRTRISPRSRPCVPRASSKPPRPPRVGARAVMAAEGGAAGTGGAGTASGAAGTGGTGTASGAAGTGGTGTASGAAGTRGASTATGATGAARGAELLAGLDSDWALRARDEHAATVAALLTTLTERAEAASDVSGGDRLDAGADRARAARRGRPPRPDPPARAGRRPARGARRRGRARRAPAPRAARPPGPQTRALIEEVRRGRVGATAPAAQLPLPAPLARTSRPEGREAQLERLRAAWAETIHRHAADRARHRRAGDRQDDPARRVRPARARRGRGGAVRAQRRAGPAPLPAVGRGARAPPRRAAAGRARAPARRRRAGPPAALVRRAVRDRPHRGRALSRVRGGPSTARGDGGGAARPARARRPPLGRSRLAAPAAPPRPDGARRARADRDHDAPGGAEQCGRERARRPAPRRARS